MRATAGKPDFERKLLVPGMSQRWKCHGNHSAFFLLIFTDLSSFEVGPHAIPPVWRPSYGKSRVGDATKSSM